MAQTFLAASMGIAANDGSGDKIRVGGLKIVADLTDLFARVVVLENGSIASSSLIRAKYNEAMTAPAGELIAFSSQFVNDYVLNIIDQNGLGIEVTAQDADGFTITAGSAGLFSYIAIVEI